MEISVFGCYPLGDMKFRDDLMKVVIGDWHIEQGSHEQHFKVVYADTFFEPVGGLMVELCS